MLHGQIFFEYEIENALERCISFQIGGETSFTAHNDHSDFRVKYISMLFAADLKTILGSNTDSSISEAKFKERLLELGQVQVSIPCSCKMLLRNQEQTS